MQTIRQTKVSDYRSNYIGGVAGKIRSTAHTASDPAYEGREASEEIASWKVWKRRIRPITGMTGIIRIYSAQTYYSVIKNVNVDGVTAHGSACVGGIASYVSNSSGQDVWGSAGQTGDGYALIHQVTVKNSQVTADYNSNPWSNLAGVGAGFGILQACIADDITLDKNNVHAVAYAGYSSGGVGGFIGDLANLQNGDAAKTCYNEETGEYEDFYYSVIQDLTVTDSSVRASARAGGVVGYMDNSYISFYDINVDGVQAAASTGGHVGGYLQYHVRSTGKPDDGDEQPVYQRRRLCRQCGRSGRISAGYYCGQLSGLYGFQYGKLYWWCGRLHWKSLCAG